MNEFLIFLEQHLNGKTLGYIERISGITKSYLSKLLNGKLKNPPKPSTLKKLSKALNCSYDELMLAAGYLPEQAHKKENISPKMQQALDLVKQIDERNLATVIGFLQGALEMQNEITRRS